MSQLTVLFTRSTSRPPPSWHRNCNIVLLRCPHYAKDITNPKLLLFRKPYLSQSLPSTCTRAHVNISTNSLGSSDDTEGSRGTANEPIQIKLLALISLVVLTGVSNRVLYKMALVPLRDHIFFLAQLQNVAYLLTYFAVLAWRVRSGLIPRAMLSIPKAPLVAVGACEAVAQLLFMAGAAGLPGALLPVVNQTYLVWSLGFAWLLLGARYTRMQLLGAALVMAGVTVAAVQPAALAGLLSGTSTTAAGPAATGAAAAAAASTPIVELRYVALCVSCFAFPAISNCIKERVFRSAAVFLGRPLDIFVVNSFGSLAQAACVLLMLPLTTALRGMALSDVPGQLAASLRVFLGAEQTPAGGIPSYVTPVLALSYVVMNLLFNISMLTLLRSVGSVTTSLVGSSLVPLTIAAFTLPLPYLEPAVLGSNFIVGVPLLMVGLATYNWDGWRGLLRYQQLQQERALAAALLEGTHGTAEEDSVMEGGEEEASGVGGGSGGAGGGGVEGGGVGGGIAGVVPLGKVQAAGG